MLTAEQISIIKATAPVVGNHARDITGAFYPLLFERYPHVQAYFNQTHQVQGTQREALAQALVAYASNIDELGQLSDAVSLITHKHCSLNIQPEHYDLVGECLMEAIAMVLGAAVTTAVADAWSAAYRQLADILINAEAMIYQQNAERRGGWQGERRFLIEAIVPESATMTSFYLVPEDQEQAIDFSAGQYVGLILTINDNVVRRNYSLSDAPGARYLRISVKHEQGGVVSGYLHQQAKEGNPLLLTAPCGDFVLTQDEYGLDKPLYLVTGGAGITPAISMLNSCVASGREIVFVHAAINSEHHAFSAHVQALASNHDNLKTFYIYEAPLPKDTPDATGYLNADMLKALMSGRQDVDLYYLGPKPFMACVNRIVHELGIPPQQVRSEWFGPREALD